MHKHGKPGVSLLALAPLCFFAAHALGSEFPETNVSTFSSVAFGFWSGTDDDGRANAEVDHLLDILQRAGVGAIQLDMQWPSFEDSRQYHFERFDHTWAACAARRIRIDARLGGLPSHDVAAKKLHCKGDVARCITRTANARTKEYKDFHEALASYTAALVDHYSELWAKLITDPTANRPLDATWDSRITWDLWNEPNWPWGGPPQVMPDILVASLATMVDRIRRRAPNDTIIAPAVAFIDTRSISPHGYGNTGKDPRCGLLYCQCPSCGDSQCVATKCYEKYGGYLEALFRQGLLGLVDGVSLHPYRPSGPETIITRPSQPLPAPQYWPATYADVRTLMNQYGGQSVKIIANEWGWANSKDFGYGDITDQRQADYLARMMLSNLSYRDSTQNGIPFSNWYQIADDGALRAGLPEYEGRFGLLDSSGNPKPSYHALQTLTQSLPNATFNTKLLDGVHPDVQLLVFRSPHGEAHRDIMATWNASNVVTVAHVQSGNGFSGTYLLNGTPLYTGQNLFWNGGNRGFWSGSKSWLDVGGATHKEWPNAGFQARFDSPDDVDVSGAYTVSGIQFNASATLRGGGALRFTPGGGNVYVAAGKRATIDTVEIANTVMNDPACPGSTITLNAPATSSLRKCGWGTLILNADNTFRGHVLVGEGLITLGSNHAIGDPLNPVTLSGGGIDLNGRNVTTGALMVTGNSSIINGSHNGATYKPKSFDINSGNLSIVTGSAITIICPIEAHRGGTLIFVGAASLNTGSILVDGGALYQNSAATLTAGSVIKLMEGGTVGGTGRIASDIHVTNGHVSPGFSGPGSIGSLSVGGDITFKAPSTLDVDLEASGACDSLAMMGTNRNVTLAGTLDIHATGSVSPGTRYPIVTNASSVEGNLTIGSAPAGIAWSLAIVPIDGRYNVVLKAD